MQRNVVTLLVVLTVGMLLGCGKHHGRYGGHDGGSGAGMQRMNEINGVIDRTIADPQKAGRLKETVQAIVTEVRQSHDKTRELHQRLYDLNARYDATPEEFTKVLDELNHVRMSTAATILRHRFKMKEQTTPEEWKALTDEMSRYRQQSRQGGRGHGSDGDRSRH